MRRGHRASTSGFTYTVLAAHTEDVIGCVYIYPAGNALGTHVRSWVRAADAGLDAPLYRAVADWLDRDWPFTRVAYAERLTSVRRS